MVGNLSGQRHEETSNPSLSSIRMSDSVLADAIVLGLCRHSLEKQGVVYVDTDPEITNY